MEEGEDNKRTVKETQDREAFQNKGEGSSHSGRNTGQIQADDDTSKELHHQGRSPDDFIPKRLADYREREYWEKRYEQDQARHYEWLLPYGEALKSSLGLKHTDHILILGCGNSRLSEDLYEAGYHNIVNIDYSEKVIQDMERRTRKTCPNMQWLVMDMRSLHFPTASFDVVLDKASLDALWTDGGSVWTPSSTVTNDVNKTLEEILRVLRPTNGRFISISFGQPHFRLPLLQRPGQWAIQVTPIRGTWYFLYQATKANT